MVSRLSVDKNTLSYYVEKSNVPLEMLQSKVADIEEILNGDKMPTFNQLSKIAQTLNVPTGLLLLKSTIDTNENLLNFRTVNSDNLNGMSNELKDTIMEMQVKQEFLRDEVDYTLDFIGKFSIEDDYLKVVEDIRGYLNIPLDYQKETGQNALEYFRNKINQIGVFVFFNGKIKDNTHRTLNVKEFRGFVLSDTKAPIIFVNQKDSKAGQLFTLIHELVHLFINQQEIFNLIETEWYTFDPTEAFVNKVTAELLVPKDEIVKLNSFDIDFLAKKFPVSKFVIVRRLLEIGVTSEAEYKAKVIQLEKEFEEISSIKKTSSGNYNNNLKFRMDKTFFRYVENAVKQNRISYTDAFNIIGVGYKGYKTLAEGDT